MSADNVAIGARSKVTLNGARLGVVSGTIRLRVDTQDVSDTEPFATVQVPAPGRPGVLMPFVIPVGAIGPRLRAHGLMEAEVTLRGLYAANVNPHQAPLNIAIGTTLGVLLIDVTGLGVAVYSFANLLCDDVSVSTCSPNQPNAWDIHGYTGFFYTP